MKTIVRHTGIVVQDLDEAVKFWTEVFGFEVVNSLLEEGPFIENLLNLPKVKVHTVKLACEGYSMIELLKFVNNSGGNKWLGTVATTGITHIALTVENIDAITRKLGQYGFKPLNPIGLSNNGEVYVCYVETFEGLLLELVQPVKVDPRSKAP